VQKVEEASEVEKVYQVCSDNSTSIFQYLFLVVVELIVCKSLLVQHCPVSKAASFFPFYSIYPIIGPNFNRGWKILSLMG